MPHEISLFELVDREILTETDSDSEIANLETRAIVTKKKQMLKIKSDNTINIDPKVEFRPEMASIDQKKYFIGMCATILWENYDSNPLSLQSVLDKIDLIEDLTEANLTVTLISFIKSKLEGKARKALPDKVNTIDEIKTALKIKIKPDNSKVVAGKIAALQVRNINYADFAKQTEELADDIGRSIVIEGMTKTKAHEMAIEQT